MMGDNLTACLEANAYYNSRIAEYHALRLEGLRPIVDRRYAYGLIAEAYLMRAETLTKGVI